MKKVGEKNKIISKCLINFWFTLFIWKIIFFGMYLFLSYTHELLCVYLFLFVPFVEAALNNNWHLNRLIQ